MAVDTPRGPKHVVYESERKKRLGKIPLAREVPIEQLFLPNTTDVLRIFSPQWKWTGRSDVGEP